MASSAGDAARDEFLLLSKGFGLVGVRWGLAEISVN